VTVSAGSITLVNGAQISSNANTYGNAGSVTVSAGSLVIDGPATTGDNFTGIASVANNPTNDANIASRAGNVTINANSLAILRNGQIATDTYTNGDAGTISVNVAGPLLIDGAGQTTKITGIFSDTFSGDGNAGAVNVNAGYGLLSNGSKIATETGAGGRGGDIVATFGTLDMNGGASISSTSTDGATGDAGSVTVNSPGVITLYGSGTTIQSRAQGSGDAGPVLITADQLILKEGASVTTEAAIGGGGNITMHLDFLLYLLRSSITTTVAGGTGSGGNIFIDPDFVVLNQSQILARAVGGNGGNIRIIAGQFFRSVDSVVDASSTLGISGQISISSPDTDVISGTVNLPTGLGSEAKLDQRACVGPGETPVLSLVPVGRGGLLLLPDASQSEPSFMLAGREGMDLPARQPTAQLRTAAFNQFAALPMAASARSCAH
jgi:large exoprotein involved in heme utilization and adhesion